MIDLHPLNFVILFSSIFTTATSNSGETTPLGALIILKCSTGWGSYYCHLARLYTIKNKEKVCPKVTYCLNCK